MTGRIGATKRIHRILKYSVPSRRGVACCGWAGEVTLVPEGVVSCMDCVRRDFEGHAGTNGAAEGGNGLGLKSD